jgi:hypothetical protein
MDSLKRCAETAARKRQMATGRSQKRSRDKGAAVDRLVETYAGR